MSQPARDPQVARVTATLSFCLVANLVALLTFPAVLPAVSAAWGLSAAEAGWIGGIYFAGYAAAVPILASATDRLDGRSVVAASALLGGAASLGFAALADGFWPALVLRFLGGVSLAGVHMPGLKALTDRIVGPAQPRSVSTYLASYAVGSAASLLIAGLVDAAWGWRATFVVGGLGPLLGFAAVVTLPRVARPSRAAASAAADFRTVVRDRTFMAYALGFAGNTWEVFGIRVWFVAALAWSLSLPGNALSLPNLAVIAGLASLAGVPASMMVAARAERGDRARVVIATCIVSVAVCLCLAASAGGPSALALALLVALQITSFADVGALGAGAVTFSDPVRRGAALAIYALAGFTSGFIGPAVVGFALDWFGGADSEAGWRAAFLTMALGSTATALAMASTFKRRR